MSSAQDLDAPGQNQGAGFVVGRWVTPSGKHGQVVSGFIAVETFNFNTDSSDQLVRIPYKYTIS